MNRPPDLETRVLEFLEGDLSPEDARALLAEAERNPELAQLIAAHTDQQNALRGYFAQKKLPARPTLPERHADEDEDEESTAGVRSSSWWKWGFAAAAVVAVGAGLTTLIPTAPTTLTVAQAEGSPAVQLLAGARIDTIAESGRVEPGRGSLKAPAGTVASVAFENRTAGFELNERSTASVSAGRRGAEIDLGRGEVIAWGEGNRRRDAVTVRAGDVVAHGSNATFSVVRGLGGAEVSVLTGAVEVEHNGERQTLPAGGRFSSVSAPLSPLVERVSWSKRGAPFITAAQVAAPARAEWAPPVLWLPTVTSTLVSTADLGGVLQELGVASPSALLSAENMADARRFIETQTPTPAMLDALKLLEDFAADPDTAPFLDSFTGAATIAAYDGGALLIAEAGDPETARTVFESRIAPALVDDPATRHIDAAFVDRWLLIGSAGAPFEEALQAAQGSRPSGFADGEFFRSLSADTAPGRLVVAVDGTALMAQAQRRNPAVATALERLGLAGLRSVVASSDFIDEARNRAIRLNLAQGATGVLAALDEPAPFGSAALVGEGAILYTAAQLRTPAESMHELAFLLGSQLGFTEIPDDVVAAFEQLGAELGNEMALSVEPPFFPLPDVRILAEISDPEGFDDSLRKLLSAIGRHERNFSWNETEYRGYTLMNFTMPTSEIPITITRVGDFALLGFGSDYVESAINQIDAGKTLENSQRFQQSLPAKSGSHASLLVYADPGEGAASLAGIMQLAGVDPAMADPASTAPSVVYMVALGNRIDVYLDGLQDPKDMAGRLPSIGQLFSLAAAEPDSSTPVDQQ